MVIKLDFPAVLLILLFRINSGLAFPVRSTSSAECFVMLGAMST